LCGRVGAVLAVDVAMMRNAMWLVEVRAVEESYPDKQMLVIAGRHGAVRETNVLTTEGGQVRRCLEEGTRTLGSGKRCRSMPHMIS
jgi:hypothetical protein